jgi:hypothetical protein
MDMVISTTRRAVLVFMGVIVGGEKGFVNTVPYKQFAFSSLPISGLVLMLDSLRDLAIAR